MPYTLVTGANSFVAAHIIARLIDEGHIVTGSIRRASAGDELLAEHPEWKGKLDFVTIEDYGKDGVWDDVFDHHAFEHVVHVAAPMVDGKGYTDYDRDFLKPSLEGNLSLLRSAKKFATALQSIAVTGSINSLTTGAPDELTANIMTNSFWSSITRDQAREAQNAFISYCSSKKEAELAIWKFVEEEKPHFTVTVFLPALIMGPPIQRVKSAKSLNFSTNIIYSIFNGSNKTVPATAFPSYIDVRDLAIAHVRALTAPEAANKRFLVGGRPLTNSDIADVLRKLSESEIPELKGRVAEPSDEAKSVVLPRIEAEEGNNIVGLEGKMRTMEGTFGDAVRKILELEKKTSS